MLELFEFLAICLVSSNCMVWQEARGPSKHGQLNRDEQPRSTGLVGFSTGHLDQVGPSWDVSFGAQARVDPSMLTDAAPKGETADYAWKQA